MIRISQIKTTIEKSSKEEVKAKVCQKWKISLADILDFKIVKQSLDARKKEDIYYNNTVDISLKKEKEFLKKYASSQMIKAPKEEYYFPETGTKTLPSRPIIIGSGPAGLFCAYILAEHGYQPLVLERGEPIEQRIKTVAKFFQTGHLEKNSNVQFGEGGAGTFSDGKLNTSVKDKEHRKKKILETFVDCGAAEDILYLQHPHIGTDVLTNVIIAMRKKIISMGGEFRYQSSLTNLVIEEEKIKAIEVNHQEIIPCQLLVLAIGHSARDTFTMLLENKLKMEAKPFAVGIRIQHPQQMINISQYGEKAQVLPPASYKLTYTTKQKRGVYSFCMCPGGYVINASSEEGYLAINGMSYQNRKGENANSAIVVTINPSDFGTSPLAGIEFQRNLESCAYQKGQGKIPVQLWKDYKENRISTDFKEVKPQIKGSYQMANLNEIFPSYINESLKEAIPSFATKIKNYDREDAILAGVESRTSAPVRILRDDLLESNIKGIYPCGEGAGYAGGIITAAMDGMKVAEAIGKKYKSL